MFYFKTANSYGWVTDETKIPPGASQIDQQAYDVLVAAALAAQAAEFQAEMQAAYLRYTDTFATYCALGLPATVAMTMAAAAGIEPPDFDPTCPPPLAL